MAGLASHMASWRAGWLAWLARLLVWDPSEAAPRRPVRPPARPRILRFRRISQDFQGFYYDFIMTLLE